MYYQYKLAHFKGSMGHGATSDEVEKLRDITPVVQYLPPVCLMLYFSSEG